MEEMVKIPIYFCTGYFRTQQYLLTGLNAHSNLLRLTRDWGGRGEGYLCPTTYPLHLSLIHI